MLNKIRRYHLSDGKHAEQSKSLNYVGNENAIIMEEEKKHLKKKRVEAAEEIQFTNRFLCFVV